MVGYILYGERTERGSRSFIHVSISTKNNETKIKKRDDNKRFYRLGTFLKKETEYLKENPQEIEKLLKGETIHIKTTNTQ